VGGEVTVSLKHVLLGSLSEKPLTGYDLKKVVDGAISHFWRAELSQIYPTLKQMQEEGLITCDVQTRNKVYHITDDGRQELIRWLKEPAGLVPQCEPLLVKVYFASKLLNGEILSVIEDRKKRHEKVLAEYQEALAGAREMANAMPAEEARDFRIKLLTLRAGILYHQAWISWCDEAAREVRQLPERGEEGSD